MKKSNNQLMMTLLKGRTFIVLIILVIFFSFASSSFLSVNTLTMVAKHVSLYGILALGMTFVIITGGIDLSVGSVLGLTGMLAGGLIQEGLTVGNKTIYFSVPAIIVLMLLTGCLIGLINGLVVTKLNVPAFIATLGTMYICRGMANLRSNGATFSKIAGFEGLGNVGLKALGTNWLGIPAGVYVFAVLAILSAVLLNRTHIGWHILAVGGNEKSARLSGIKADRVKILVYIISGFCAAWIGLINTAQLSA
ncbi:MAG: ABC transporter permease, partial [Clostridia bacterium]|nr:ABC transporter permease [Clostridia bacterium]